METWAIVAHRAVLAARHGDYSSKTSTMGSGLGNISRQAVNHSYSIIRKLRPSLEATQADPLSLSFALSYLLSERHRPEPAQRSVRM